MKNGSIKNIKKEVLSHNWYTLNKFTFDYQREDDSWEEQEREVYDCGDAAAILLINKKEKSVVLTKQFRMPAYQNNHKPPMLVEVCAGLLDGDSPEVCIKKEALEETGYKVQTVTKVFESFMVPGTVMQKVHFFIGYVTDADRVHKGGGSVNETENIEVLHMSFDTAFDMIATGEIVDGKSIMLLQHAKIYELVS
ncbi:MAG: NUDIX domain-containing protein [Cellulophaga sp.]|nr:NUDIX domain-containing protein [Cellulophaga sp.]